MKRIMTLTIAFCMLCLTVTGAEKLIVDSMDFQGSNTLTFEKAVEMALKSNAALVQCDLDIAVAQNALDQKDEKMKGILKAYRHIDPKSLTYQNAVTNPQRTLKFQFEKANRKKQGTINTIEVNVQTQYYNLLFALKQVEIYRDNLKIVEKTDAQTTKKLELGTIAKQEVINSQLSLIKAQNELNAAENSVKKAKMALNVLIGQDVMSEIIPDGSLEIPPYELGSIAKAVTNTFNNNGMIKDLEFALEMAKFDLEYLGMGNMTETYPYKEKKLNLDKAMMNYQNVKAGAETLVRNSYLDVTQKKAETVKNMQAKSNAGVALNISDISFEAGVSVLSDKEKAQVAKLQADITLSQSILDYILAIAAYEDNQAVGRTAVASATQLAASSN
ncbi:MAG: TolC family protein [Hyphomonadaceae bacterium]|nr:TolC family protein [Clostridia bacterium]